MAHHYEDITSRIGEPPAWFDDNGCPRYGMFTPSALPDIYADEAALVEIACHECKRRFRVGISANRAFETAAGLREGRSFDRLLWRLAAAIAERSLHYGDPPIYGHADDCCAGVTMGAMTLRVIEYWRRHDPAHVGPQGIVKEPLVYMTWRRLAEFEIAFDTDEPTTA